MNSSAMRSPTIEHAAAAESVDEGEQALLALGLAGQRMNGCAAYEHQSLPSIQLARGDQVVDDGVGGQIRAAGCGSSAAP